MCLQGLKRREGVGWRLARLRRRAGHTRCTRCCFCLTHTLNAPPPSTPPNLTQHAAESQLLKSATYQRLMAGCAVKSAGFLAVLLANIPATFE